MLKRIDINTLDQKDKNCFILFNKEKDGYIDDENQPLQKIDKMKKMKSAVLI